MKRMIVAAALALAVVGSTFGTASTPALAALESEVDQFVVDSQSLSNIEHTQDSPQPQTDLPAVQDCTCMVFPEAAPLA